MDVLRHHRLLLDIANQRVFSPASRGSPEINLASAAWSLSSSLHANLFFTPQCISDLLSNFPDVCSFDGFIASPPDPPPPADSPWSFGICETSMSGSREACLRQASSPPWRMQGLYVIQRLLGLPPFTWFVRKSKAGGHVEITGG